MQKVIKGAISCAKLAGIFVGMVLAGYLLLVAVYCIPTDGRMQTHLKETAPYYESFYTFSTAPETGGYLDYNTDGYMLLNAGANGKATTGNPFSDSLLVQSNRNKDRVPSYRPVGSLIDIYTKDIPESQIITFSYERYWHGYLIFLKPLLLLFNYGEIRYINMFVILGLAFLFLFLLHKRKKDQYWLPFIASFFFLNPVALSLSIQYTNIYVNVLVQLILLEFFIARYQKSNFRIAAHFLIFGACASYFDFLTYPIVSLGIPLLYWVLENQKQGKTLVWDVFQNSALWCIGYLGMWGSKWLLGTWITGVDIVGNALNQMKMRTGSVNYQGDPVNYGDVLQKQWSSFKFTFFILLALWLFLLIFFLVRKQYHIPKIDLCRLILTAVIAFYPFVWYLLTMNHAWQHQYMTYRCLSITVFFFFLLLFPKVFQKSTVPLNANPNEHLAEDKKNGRFMGKQ